MTSTSTGKKQPKTPRAGLAELFAELRRVCLKHHLTAGYIARETGYKGAGKILSGDRITVSQESEYLLRTFIHEQIERFRNQGDLFPVPPPVTEDGVPANVILVDEDVAGHDWKGEALSRRLECVSAIQKMGEQATTISNLTTACGTLQTQLDKRGGSLTTLYGELATVTERLAKAYRVIEEQVNA